VAGELRLSNLRSLHARVELLGPGRFDVITSRAFGSLLELAELTSALLAPNGVWLAMKGEEPEDEIREARHVVDVFHVEQLRIPGLNARRCLVWMRPSQ
jgi:16S rRNA (guanine527-N7)-methyltransferase